VVPFVDVWYTLTMYRVLLLTHTVHSMQIMLHICDKFAENFDIKFNSSKSVAMRIGSRYGEKCAALQLSGKDILHVNELKFLGVHMSLLLRVLNFQFNTYE